MSLERFDDHDLDELAKDGQEMTCLLKSCRSSRLRSNLQLWVQEREDFSEMARLLKCCRSRRLAKELQPWLDKHEVTRGTPQSAPVSRDAMVRPAVVESPTPLSGDGRPVVLLVGPEAASTLLLSVLADGEDAVGSLETRYYSAEVKYVLLDPATAMETDAQKALIESAEAVILIWDLAQPDTLRAVTALLPGAAPVDDDDFVEDGPDRVQMCLAVDGYPFSSLGQNATVLDAAEDEARVWCVENSYELLRCPLGQPDLEALKERRRGAQEGRSVSLLAEDTDGSVLRLLEALECHSAWPNLRKKEQGTRKTGTTATSSPARPQELPEQKALPMLLFAGLAGCGHKELASAIAGGDASVGTEVELETKYYRVRLLVRAVDIVEGREFETASLFRDAAGLMLAWEEARPESFQVVHRTVALAAPEEGEEFCNTWGVKLLAVMGGNSATCTAGGTSTIRSEASIWCTEHNFELLCCSTESCDLEALSGRWRAAGAGAKLLGDPANSKGEDPASCGAVRIAEACECHAWPGLELKSQAKAQDAVSKAKTQSGGDNLCSDSKAEADVEEFERLSEEMKQVRNITDEQKRKDRACDLALRLAASLGIDSDSE
eukprot:TRINITY_DN23302_c0_g1_i1.p1 TRINITY_DN23302_c0_g1~~TRINITY_DN23302_c0_g1_i1.p1  ORF type:complete len:618 (+),score=147.08 TRINITY_DN23302_c0_g1_i1:35-1855(+)